VSLLLTYLPAYLKLSIPITSNLVLGVSLGGHAAWLTVLHEPRITAAVVVIGCPDYASLMMDRAVKSKLKDWTSGTPPGSAFLGSGSFPPALISAVGQFDPAALILPSSSLFTVREQTSNPLGLLSGKRILSLSGGADKLVPYKCSKPFLALLGQKSDVHLIDMVFDGVGHTMSPDMLAEAVDFVMNVLGTPDKVRNHL